MTALWIAFFVTFAMSLLALTSIHTSVARARGWRALSEVPFADKYWRDLSPLLRWLLWPGLIAFALVFGAGGVSVIVQHVR